MEPKPLRVEFTTPEYVTEKYYYGGPRRRSPVRVRTCTSPADALIRAWSHPNLARMGEAARLKVSEFAPERTIRTLLEYYREVLGG